MAYYYGYVRAAVCCDDDGGMSVGLERGDESDRREGRVISLLGDMLGMARGEGLLLDVFDPGGLGKKWMYRLLGDEGLPLGSLPFDVRLLSDFYNRPYMAWFGRDDKPASRVELYRGNVVLRVGGGVVGVSPAGVGIVGDDGLVYSNRSVWRLFEAMYAVAWGSRRGVIDLHVPGSRGRGSPGDLDERLGALLGRFEYRGRGGAEDVERRREDELRAEAAREVGVSLVLLRKGDRVFLGCLPVDARGKAAFESRVESDRLYEERRELRRLARVGSVAAI